MKSPEQILEDDERFRRKRDEYKNALTDLQNSTGRNRWGGIGHLLFSGLLVVMVWTIYSGPEPMTKSDGLRLILFGSMISFGFYMGAAQLFLSAKDVALKNLIEERLKEYEE